MSDQTKPTEEHPASCANNCGRQVTGYEDGIDCPTCRKWFCDSCYDTNLENRIGISCRCHQPEEETP